MLETIKKNFKKFIILWFFVFLGTLLLLSLLNLVPKTWENSLDLKEEGSPESFLEKKLTSIPESLPKRIIIPEINVDIPIINPTSKKIEDLDKYLQEGVVRYPSSGLLGQKTNILLFGHSSYLPVVRNNNYKALNNLRDLKERSEIILFSPSHKFIYEVVSVKKSEAQDALVVFESNQREITVSTCDSFGNLNDRFVARALLVDVLEI